MPPAFPKAGGIQQGTSLSGNTFCLRALLSEKELLPMSTKLSLTSLIVAGSLCAALSSAQAQTNTISFHFSGNSNTPQNLKTTDVAGVPSVAASNYNEVPGSSGTVNNLGYSDGSNSGASLTFVSYDAQNNGLDDPNANPNYASQPNSKLMNGFIESGPANTPPSSSRTPNASVTVSNLSFATPYSVYVYFYNADGNTGGNMNSQNGTFTITTSTNPNGVSMNAMTLSSFDVNNPFTQATATTPGDYLVFSGITGSSFTLTADRQTGDNSTTTFIPIDGFQIVGTPAAAPEPAGFVPFVLGAVLLGGLVAARRRTAGASA